MQCEANLGHLTCCGHAQHFGGAHNVFVKLTVWQFQVGTWHKYTSVTHSRQSDRNPSTGSAMRGKIVSTHLVLQAHAMILSNSLVWWFQGEIWHGYTSVIDCRRSDENTSSCARIGGKVVCTHLVLPAHTTFWPNSRFGKRRVKSGTDTHE